MSSMEDFFTSDRAEEGIKVPLTSPDGKDTDHWLQLRGIDSNVFRTAEAQSRRTVLKLAVDKELDESDKQDRVKDEERKVLSSLIKAWSFDMECTPENIITLLTKAPQIEDMVNKITAQRTLFFREAVKNSSDGSQPSKD